MLHYNGSSSLQLNNPPKTERMKKIMFAVFAISALVLLNSCESKSGQMVATHRGLPSDMPNGAIETTIGTTYGEGKRDQTSTNSITYTGTIDGISDVDMVPVRMCSNELVWAKFADNSYKIGVEANQYVAKGYRVDVTMRIVKPWFAHDYFEIIDIKIFPKNPVNQSCGCDTATPAPVVKKPVRRIPKQRLGIANEFFPTQIPTQRWTPVAPQPVTIQQPCCCGTNITINGTNNAPIITGNGNNLGGGGSTAPAQKQEPILVPSVPKNDGPKDFNVIPNGKSNLDSSKNRNVVTKNEMKKEPMTWPWTKD